MGHYFFSLHDGSNPLDDDSIEIGTFDEVRNQAIQFIGLSLIDAKHRVFSDGNWRLDVADDNHVLLFSVHVITQDTVAAIRHIIPYDIADKNAQAA